MCAVWLLSVWLLYQISASVLCCQYEVMLTCCTIITLLKGSMTDILFCFFIPRVKIQGWNGCHQAMCYLWIHCMKKKRWKGWCFTLIGTPTVHLTGEFVIVMQNCSCMMLYLVPRLVNVCESNSFWKKKLISNCLKALSCFATFNVRWIFSKGGFKISLGWILEVTFLAVHARIAPNPYLNTLISIQSQWIW